MALPRRLLREPHVLAHELRTPLAIVAGWTSLMRNGDVHPDRTPQAWAEAMDACDAASARLNILINEACGEIEALNRLRWPGYRKLVEETTSAIEHSRRIRAQLRATRRGSEAKQSRTATPNR